MHFGYRYIADAVPAILIAFTLFIIPATLTACCQSESNGKYCRKTEVRCSAIFYGTF